MTEHERQPSAAPDQSVGRQAAAGVLWLTVQKWAVRLSGLVTIAVLTRFLSPEDFGVVAAASTVLPFFYLLADLGFAAYIVQVDRADRRLLSTAFWFSCVAGVVLSVAVVGAAPLFGLVFGSGDVVPVLQVLALAVLITALSSVPTAILRREMRFRTLAVQGTVASVTAQVVAVAMTLTGAGVWALVGQVLTVQTATGLLAWTAARWWPGFTFSRTQFTVMARYGGQVLGVECVAVCRQWAETAIISVGLGLAALGYLNIAQRLVQIVQELTGAALLPVTMVAFAKIRDSAERLREAYLRALRMTYAILAPPLTLLAVAAPLILPLVFGAGWEESVPVARILALAGIMVVGATLDHGLFYGLGRPGRWFVYALVIDALTVAVTALTVRWGLVGVATGFLVVAAVATASRWFLVARLLRAQPRALAGPFGFLAAAVPVGAAAGWVVMTATAGLPPIVRVGLTGITILAAYAGVTVLLARSVITDIAGYLPGRDRPDYFPRHSRTSYLPRHTRTGRVSILVNSMEHS
ncbi:lipopolysaccharide biosynthesis protein [Jiangella aurantiaca]|uniref:Lipopolysaccharide biosynthesis protein n=1 Tax=Jiangella aurantiaca TaxID=2530373 RepID=A0A4R5AEH9_9ACTN|nr:lipopolysaccharide biosynthesis protein [Jiangella aurantiaca]TDD70938.1 lipopolysaccharide biosynthesis protein [Jiangella aurantiaca]